MSDLPPISGKVGLDTTDFKTAIAELNRDIRVIESGFKATAASMGDWASTATGLEERIKALNSQIGIQQQKVDLLRAEYERIAQAQGADSRAAEELQIKLNREAETLGRMQSELGRNTEALTDLGNAEDEVGKKAEGAGGGLDGLNVGMVNLASTIDVVQAGIGIAIDVIGGMINAVVNLGKSIVNLVLDTAEYADNLNDLSAKTGISTDRLQEFDYVAKQIGTSTDTITGSMARLTRSMATAQQQAQDFSAGTVAAASKAAAETAKVEEEYGAKTADIQGKLIEIEQDLGKQRVSIQQELGDALAAVERETARNIEKLQEQHLGKIASLQASVASVAADYEYDKAERAEDTERNITRMTEDYSHDREGLVKDLAAAETDAQKASIQARIDEMDYEYNTRKKRQEEDAKEAESDAQHQADAKIKALQEQIAAENVEYGKQHNELLARQAEQEAATNARYDKELAAAVQRYDGEVAAANKALGEVAAAREKALADIAPASVKVGDMAAAFERLGVKVTDANGNLRDNQAVFGDLMTALGNVQNPAERDALAMQLFGKSAQELNPLIKTSADEFARLAEEAHKVGAVMSPEDLANLGKLADTLDSLKSGFAGLMGTLATGFLPIFQSVADTLKNVMADPAVQEGIRKIAERLGELAQRFADFVKSPDFDKWIQQIINWLMNDLPKAIETTTRFWDETLYPAIVKLSLFMRDDFLPVAKQVWDFLAVVLPPVIEALGVVLNVLAAGWRLQWWLIDTFILPIFRTFEDTIKNVVLPIVERLKKFWDDIGANMVTGIWQGMKNRYVWFMEQIAGFFTDIVTKIHDILLMHSPSQVFAGIGANMAIGLGQGFGQAFAAIEGNIAGAVGGMASGMGQAAGRAGDSYNVTINYPNQSPGGALADIRMLQMLYGEA